MPDEQMIIGGPITCPQCGKPYNCARDIHVCEKIMPSDRAEIRIPRYSMILGTKCGEGWQDLERDDEYGDWMHYEDHLREVERLRELLRESYAALILIRAYAVPDMRIQDVDKCEELLAKVDAELGEK